MPADLPVAAPDHARIEALREEAARGGLYQVEDGPVVRVPSWEEVTFLLDALDALLAERQQDKERIKRLEAALREIASQASDRPDLDVCDYIEDYARAALAVEEDAE